MGDSYRVLRRVPLSCEDVPDLLPGDDETLKKPNMSGFSIHFKWSVFGCEKFLPAVA